MAVLRESVGAGGLAAPMEQAVELAWTSFSAGSLGIGAVITQHGEVLATGRNRLGETDPGDDVLAGTTLAHAEMNALAKVRVGTPSDGLELWTTLQPCLQCLGAIRLSPVRRVHVLAPDPLFRGVEGARHLTEFIGRDWPDIFELAVDEWSVFSLLLHTHVALFWGIEVHGWCEALPVDRGAGRRADRRGRPDRPRPGRCPAGAATEVVGDRLGSCVTDVEHVAALQIRP